MAQEAKHTPGPWEYLDIGEVAAGDDLSITIAIMNDGDASPHVTETEANACLIAAAPDMFAALRDLIALFEEIDGGDHHDAPELVAARTALAKTGGA